MKPIAKTITGTKNMLFHTIHADIKPLRYVWFISSTEMHVWGSPRRACDKC
jgi:hypothetical protein